ALPISPSPKGSAGKRRGGLPTRVTANLLRDTNDLNHLGNGVDADDMRTREDRGRYRGRCSPIPLGRRPHAQGALHERLARGTDQHGTVQPGGELRQPGQHTITISRTFGKPDPGVDDQTVPPDARPGGDRQARLYLSAYLADDIVVMRLPVHRLRTPARVHEDECGS